MRLGSDVRQWAEKIFGGCDLGDSRRVDRLVDLAAHQAAKPKASICAAFEGDPAGAEGAYRFLRNEDVSAADIDESYWDLVAEEVCERELVALVQDTTTLRYDHRAREDFGNIGGAVGTKARGLIMHSTLAIDVQTGEPIGLLDQDRAKRATKRAGRDARKRRAYRDKESFKWQRASERCRSRLTRSDHVIEVCDREADVIQYLEHQSSVQGRFVVRSCYDRRLVDGEHLHERLARQPAMGVRHVEIAQRGPQRGGESHKARPGRAARTAELKVRAARVSLHGGRNGKPVEVWVVHAAEINAPKDCEPVSWWLLTSEAADSFSAASAVLRTYELRWVIEDFHKALKTGCIAEQRTLDADNLERLNAILAPIAVRLLQLRSAAAPTKPAQRVLDTDELTCLRMLVRQKYRRPLPRRLTAEWALHSIARLGGWMPKTKGRPGWQSLFQGWQRFSAVLHGWILARSLGTTEI